MAQTLSRRLMLRGALGGLSATLALPLLEAMTPKRARGQTMPADPVRVGLWFWGCGVHRENFVPPTTGHNLTLKSQLQPFAAVKPYLTIVTGYDVKTVSTGHHSSRAGAVAGSYDGALYGFPSTPSFEQVAANARAGQTRFKSLEVMVSQQGFMSDRPVSSSWNGSPIAPERSPQAFFDRLFGTGFTAGATTQQVNNRIAARRSVLDLTLNEGNALKSKVGTADKTRLDIHFESIRELEKRLEAMESTTVPSVCAAPGRPATDLPTVNGHEPLQAKARVFSDMVAIALACDLTRSFYFQMSPMQSSVVVWDTGVNEGLHELTHNGARRADVNKGITYQLTEYAYLMNKLASIPEGGKTLLDNCCILGTSDHGDATIHDWVDYPFIVGGRAGGKLKGDLHVRGNGSSASRVHLTLLQAAGISVSQFGAGAGMANQPIPELYG